MRKRTAFKKWLKVKGYTAEDFAQVLRDKGFKGKKGTVSKWMQGTEPRPFTMSVLIIAFPSIKF